MDRWFRVRPGRGRSDEDVLAIRELLGPLDPAAGQAEPVMAPVAPMPRARTVRQWAAARPARVVAALLAGTAVAAGATATAIAGLSQETPTESISARCFFAEGIDPDRPLPPQYVIVAFGGQAPMVTEKALEMCNSLYANPLPFTPQVVAPGRAVCITSGVASVFPVRPGITCAELGLPEAVPTPVP